MVHLLLQQSPTLSSGFAVYIVRFNEEGDGATAVDFQANRDPEQYKETDDARDVQMLTYLINTLLLYQPAEFPGLGGPLGAWSMAGRASLGQQPNPKQ